MANSNDQRILELAEKATPKWEASTDRPDAIISHSASTGSRVDTEALKWYGGNPIAESLRQEDRLYAIAAANCAPDLVQRIAALRAALFAQRHIGKPKRDCSCISCQTIHEVLEADDALCATMKVGDE